MKKEDILKIIDECSELQLANGATGAIWKNELIEKINEYYESESVVYNKIPVPDMSVKNEKSFGKLRVLESELIQPNKL